MLFLFNMQFNFIVENVISIAEKKVVPWAAALVVFITKEAKRFGWDSKTKVRVIATKDGKIIIEKA